MRDRQKTSLGPFSSDLVCLYYTLMTRRGARPLSVDELRTGWDGKDWLGGRSEDIGFWPSIEEFLREGRTARLF